ncbi:MAG: hypothetical protein AB1782_07995 [Cyanobacteriota bacterium]
MKNMWMLLCLIGFLFSTVSAVLSLDPNFAALEEWKKSNKNETESPVNYPDKDINNENLSDESEKELIKGTYNKVLIKNYYNKPEKNAKKYCGVTITPSKDKKGKPLENYVEPREDLINKPPEKLIKQNSDLVNQRTDGLVKKRGYNDMVSGRSFDKLVRQGYSSSDKKNTLTTKQILQQNEKRVNSDRYKNRNKNLFNKPVSSL